mmetsp:Transcript_35593/g.70769  ORF Transcript_35593/g.70769 Transcript_35593/m.70769 type:complete len:98 (+) Transcript_35593:172-465(+)
MEMFHTHPFYSSSQLHFSSINYLFLSRPRNWPSFYAQMAMIAMNAIPTAKQPIIDIFSVGLRARSLEAKYDATISVRLRYSSEPAARALAVPFALTA